MADSDDEDTLVSFGTPFELLEEDAPRKKAVPIHDQIVTDSEGRRRFHGAFTGGFSAGYFNSVGTKEGWQPSTFVSSRSKKFEHRAQRPEDFMDDEDMGEFGIAPKRITTKEEFLSEEQEIQNRRKRIVASDDSQGIIPGEPILQDLVLPVKMSVGVELLKKMGWKEGQGVGPRERRTKKKVYGCPLPPGVSSSQTTGDNTEEEDIFAIGLLFAPKDVDTFTFMPKDDKHGLGYKGLDPSTALFVREDWLGVDPVSSKIGKKGIRGKAFGVGAFEEDDDDIYAIDHMSHYDVELTAECSSGLHGWTGPPKENARGGALSIFSATPKAMEVMKSFPPPVVPREFNCTHKFNSSASDPTSSTLQESVQERKTLSASDRGKILGEEALPTPKKSVFDYMSKGDKDRVLSSSKKITPKPSSVASGSSANSSAIVSAQDLSSKVWSGHSSFKPFAKDPGKQARYEEFLNMGKGEQVSQQIKESGLTEWEREREKEEFARSASLYRPLNSTMAARFTTAKHPDDHRTVYEDVPAQEPSDSSEQTKAARMKMFGKLTRDTFEWHPNNILCKRFNIPNPYPGSDAVGVPKLRRPKFTLGDFITPQTESSPRAVTYGVLFTSSEGQRKSDNIGKRSEAIESKVSETPSESAVVKTSDFTSTRPVGSSFKPTSITTSKGPEAAANVLSNTSEQTALNQAQGDEESAPKRPSMDLFKAIFADSSEDESNISDGEKDKKSESLSIQTQTEDKAASEATNVHAELKTDSIEETDTVLSERKMSEEEELNSAKESEMSQMPPAIETMTKVSTEEEREKSTPDVFGPALPPSLRHTKISVTKENRTVDLAHNDEELNCKRSITRDKRKDTKKRYSESSDSENDDSSRKKELSGHLSSEKYSGNRTESGEGIVERKRGDRKGKRKDAKKRDSGSSDSEDDYRSKRRHKNKEKKHKHKHKSKSKHRDEKKEKSSEKKEEQHKSNQTKEAICVSEDKQILNKLKNLQNLKAGKRMRAADFM